MLIEHCTYEDRYIINTRNEFEFTGNIERFTMTDQDNLIAREKLVDTAVKFLKNAKVAGSPLKTKQEFLKRKGLTDEEIERACKLSALYKVHDQIVLPTEDKYTTIAIPSPAHMYPYNQHGVFQPTVLARVKQFFDIAASVGATVYCVYLFYKKFIQRFIFGNTKKDTIQHCVVELDKTIRNMTNEMKESITKIESSVKQLMENQSADPTIPHLVQELKQDLASLKGLLLSRKQFPSAPPSIPAWQLDTSGQTHEGKTTEHEDDAHSGSSTNNSDSSLEMIREDPPKE